MNFKSLMAISVLALVGMSLTSTLPLQKIAYADLMGMSLTAQASEGSDTIVVRGQTASKVTDLTLTVTSPDGFNTLAIDQLTPGADGKFSTQFKISPLWKQSGFYTITAMQGVHKNSLYTMSVEVEVVDGMAIETLTTESNLETGFFMEKPEALTIKGLIIKAKALPGSTTIGITGQSDRTNIDVTIKVIAPNGNVVSVEQITPNLDGKFSKNITTGGPLWTQDGVYRVIAQQGESSDHISTVEVEIEDGVVVPEFGAIAAMILAVAIISIIVVSAKSRLSIIPRY